MRMVSRRVSNTTETVPFPCASPLAQNRSGRTSSMDPRTPSQLAASTATPSTVSLVATQTEAAASHRTSITYFFTSSRRSAWHDDTVFQDLTHTWPRLVPRRHCVGTMVNPISFLCRFRVARTSLESTSISFEGSIEVWPHSTRSARGAPTSHELVSSNHSPKHFSRSHIKRRNK